jgi:hypothetical protein
MYDIPVPTKNLHYVIVNTSCFIIVAYYQDHRLCSILKTTVHKYCSYCTVRYRTVFFVYHVLSRSFKLKPKASL